MFSPLAWLKLQYFCHAGDTEVGGFGITSADRPLYIEEFETVRQRSSPVSVHFADEAVADYFDRSVDRGLKPERFGRIWLHTHPGASVTPSGTDEATFARCFGACDWSLMFILSRTGNTYARLTIRVGPGAELLLPVQVDWSAWPLWVGKEANAWQAPSARWEREFQANVVREDPFESILPFADQRLLLAGAEWWHDDDRGVLRHHGLLTESLDGEFIDARHTQRST
jgi:hypothetical protein